MSKTSVFTSITPLPAGITRQSVLDTYHNHTEMIELNPLVVERFRCKPPNYAPSEEFYSTWYTIKDRVSYLPGGLATGSVSYHACFHDLPDGLQTHVYAPLGLDIRAKWSVGGSLPGEPRAPVELGIGAPREGLYIREDVRMRCNIMMMGFVKKTFKESHAKLVDRLVEKAHILESEAANARLKMLREVAPGERMGHGSIFIAPPPGYTPMNHQQQEFEDDYFGGTLQQQLHESPQLPLYQEYHPERHSGNSSHSSPQLQRLYHRSLSSTHSSNPSSLSSPHPSYASTHTSNNLLSPAPLNTQKPLPSPPPLSQERRCLHKHTHSADFNSRDAMHCDPHPQDAPPTESRPRSSTIATAIPAAEQQTLDTLPATTYLPPSKYTPATLPATSYLPTSRPRERSRSPGPAPNQDLPPLPAELPGTTYYPAESPILGRHMDFPAELPA